MKKLLKKIKKNKKWKVYLYYNNRLIKTLKRDDTFKPLEEIYAIRVLFKKYLMGSWNTRIVCVASGIKFTNETKKEVHIEVAMFGGV